MMHKRDFLCFVGVLLCAFFSFGKTSGPTKKTTRNDVLGALLWGQELVY